jgi:CrcB protein
MAAVFAGGALGSVARFGIILLIGSSAISVTLIDLTVTFVVNLAGALLLGVVNASRSSSKLKLFLGTGFAGGFTTMSAVSFIAGSTGLGFSSMGYLYWLALIGQLVLGVILYRLGTGFRRSIKKSTADR